jgi:hypothetical protein
VAMYSTWRTLLPHPNGHGTTRWPHVVFWCTGMCGMSTISPHRAGHSTRRMGHAFRCSFIDGNGTISAQHSHLTWGRARDEGAQS